MKFLGACAVAIVALLLGAEAKVVLGFVALGAVVEWLA